MKIHVEEQPVGDAEEGKVLVFFYFRNNFYKFGIRQELIVVRLSQGMRYPSAGI